VWNKKGNYFIDPEDNFLSLNGVLFENTEIFTFALGELSKKDFIIEQFTGLKDKNGTKIFEGDILTFPNDGYDPSEGESPVFLAGIRWDEKYLTWEIYDEDVGEIESLWEYLDENNNVEGEVIGNIHENPELLEKE
jgi:uncharacterized phage protein (TIGR01671 family)